MRLKLRQSRILIRGVSSNLPGNGGGRHGMDEAYLAAARASILWCPSNERWIGQTTILKADDVVGSDRLVDGTDGSTRLSAIRAARFAASAPPAAIRSSTMSTIAQCRRSSASSSSGVGGLPSGMALISAGRFDLNISSVCHGRSRECSHQWPTTGPSAFFQAAMPPSMWQAEVTPASCAACTAIAERSPYAQ